MTRWLVHIVRKQSHTNLFVCSIHYVKYVMSQFELFIHVLGYCRYQHWGQVFLSSTVFCCNEQPIPQSQKLVEICVSHCKILDRSDLFILIFLENFEFYIQVNGLIFWPIKISKSILAFAKVHIVGTN